MLCAASADPILFSLSPFDSVTYLSYFGLAATFAPRRVAPIGFRATKLDMVCVPILRPAGIALPALKLDWWHTQLLHPVMADHPRNIVRPRPHFPGSSISADCCCCIEIENKHGPLRLLSIPFPFELLCRSVCLSRTRISFISNSSFNPEICLDPPPQKLRTSPNRRKPEEPFTK